MPNPNLPNHSHIPNPNTPNPIQHSHIPQPDTPNPNTPTDWAQMMTEAGGEIHIHEPVDA